MFWHISCTSLSKPLGGEVTPKLALQFALKFLSKLRSAMEIVHPTSLGYQQTKEGVLLKKVRKAEAGNQILGPNNHPFQAPITIPLDSRKVLLMHVSIMPDILAPFAGKGRDCRQKASNI